MKKIPEDIEDLMFKYGSQVNKLQAEELYNAVLSTPDGPVIEIGSATGGTTIMLIRAAKKVGKMVYSVDPYPVEMEGVARDYAEGEMVATRQMFAENILEKESNIIQLNYDLIDCIDLIPYGISVAFIDGLHELANVKREYNLLIPRMCKGGIMYFHDMGFDAGQLSPEGALTEFPAWVQRGEIVEKSIGSDLERLRQMLKIVV